MKKLEGTWCLILLSSHWQSGQSEYQFCFLIAFLRNLFYTAYVHEVMTIIISGNKVEGKTSSDVDNKTFV